METMLIAGLAAAVGFYIILMKIGIRKFLKYGVVTDIIISIVLGVIFIGTMSGMMIGIFAGIFISLFLTVHRTARRIIGSPE